MPLYVEMVFCLANNSLLFNNEDTRIPTTSKRTRQQYKPWSLQNEKKAYTTFSRPYSIGSRRDAHFLVLSFERCFLWRRNMILLREGPKAKLQVPEKKVIKKIFEPNTRRLLSG